MAEADGKGEPKSKRKRATRREKALRDSRRIRLLASGQTINEVAAREGIPLRRARERVSAILARRVDTPAEFAEMQIRRLNEAMVVAYASMRDGNLKAVDRVIRITREYDRYHGFAPILAAAAAALPPPPLALAPAAPVSPQNDEATLNLVSSD